MCHAAGVQERRSKLVMAVGRSLRTLEEENICFSSWYTGEYLIYGANLTKHPVTPMKSDYVTGEPNAIEVGFAVLLGHVRRPPSCASVCQQTCR